MDQAHGSVVRRLSFAGETPVKCGRWGFASVDLGRGRLSLLDVNGYRLHRIPIKRGDRDVHAGGAIEISPSGTWVLDVMSAPLRVWSLTRAGGSQSTPVIVGEIAGALSPGCSVIDDLGGVWGPWRSPGQESEVLGRLDMQLGERSPGPLPTEGSHADFVVTTGGPRAVVSRESDSEYEVFVGHLRDDRHVEWRVVPGATGCGYRAEQCSGDGGRVILNNPLDMSPVFECVSVVDARLECTFEVDLGGEEFLTAFHGVVFDGVRRVFLMDEASHRVVIKGLEGNWEARELVLNNAELTEDWYMLGTVGSGLLAFVVEEGDVAVVHVP